MVGWWKQEARAYLEAVAIPFTVDSAGGGRRSKVACVAAARPPVTLFPSLHTAVPAPRRAAVRRGALAIVAAFADLIAPL